MVRVHLTGPCRRSTTVVQGSFKPRVAGSNPVAGTTPIAVRVAKLLLNSIQEAEPKERLPGRSWLVRHASGTLLVGRPQSAPQSYCVSTTGNGCQQPVLAYWPCVGPSENRTLGRLLPQQGMTPRGGRRRLAARELAEELRFRYRGVGWEENGVKSPMDGSANLVVRRRTHFTVPDAQEPPCTGAIGAYMCRFLKIMKAAGVSKIIIKAGMSNITTGMVVANTRCPILTSRA